MSESPPFSRARVAHATLLVALLAASSSCSSPTGQAERPEDLVAHWRFDEGTGVIAQDASQYANTATLSRPLWSPGRDGAALALDGGNDDIVSVPVSASLRRTRGAITIAAWTWRDAVHNVAVVSHGYPALFFGFHGPQFKWHIEYLGGLHAACYADPKHVAALGRWIHIAATYDGLAARLYADGRQICRTWALGPLTMPETPFTIGGYLDSNGRIVDEMTGRIDDVRIYARALSADEILNLAGAPANVPPPVM